MAKAISLSCGILLLILASVTIYIATIPPPKENFIITGLKESLTVLNPEFSRIDIREGSSSYTEDKSVIYLCLKDPQGNMYPQNTLIYVILHEIAHMLNTTNYGHTPEFYKIFNELLCKASDKGVYDPTIPHAKWYCGVDISGITMPSCNVE